MNERRSWSETTVGELLSAFASSAPVPGGGSAAALAGATGVALFIMAAGLRKPAHIAAPPELAAATARLRLLLERLTALVDRDSDAYASVVSARRLPKADEAEAAARRRAIDAAMRAATEAPLDTMRACRQALAEAPVVASHVLSSARSDVAAGIELLQAAVRAAGLNVDANLPSVQEEAYARRVGPERRQLETESAADAVRGLALLFGPPSGS